MLSDRCLSCPVCDVGAVWPLGKEVPCIDRPLPRPRVRWHPAPPPPKRNTHLPSFRPKGAFEYVWMRLLWGGRGLSASSQSARWFPNAFGERWRTERRWWLLLTVQTCLIKTYKQLTHAKSNGYKCLAATIEQLMLLNFPVVARFLKMMSTCETRSVNTAGCVWKWQVHSWPSRMMICTTISTSLNSNPHPKSTRTHQEMR